MRVDAGIWQHPLEIGRVGVNSIIHDNAHGIPPIQREILIKGNWVDSQSLPARRQA